MRQVLHLLDRMRDNILQIEYAVKKDEISSRDFDKARDLMGEQGDLLSDLRSELAMSEDHWKNS
ncbi:MAG: hypothetical protein NE328_03955 [Lentisphaeraceae bacterium]|nr:hypothetical protein [Lentisphaeraceae bacterium]